MAEDSNCTGVMAPKFDALESFFNWWMSCKAQRPPCDEIINVDGQFTEIILYREGQFQVQLVIAQPDTEIPDHIHPGVDSYEVYMSGDLRFRRDADAFCPQDPGISHLRVLPESYHGATVGPRGGTFLSIQHWTDPTVQPSFISHEWGYADENEKVKSKCIK